MHTVYILHSQSLDKHYIGRSENLETRINQHLNKFYLDSFTTRADDWRVIFTIECTNKSQALAIEHHIKQMKSTVYIKNLIKYPEMTQKLLTKFKSVGSSR
ncbi:GIY-YIG nuclease family protein [Reichenbachiella sp.]|uniref:GIY-YIG nuclease family protein n=1 Tax=Reichenbachiella sp. TaxID=2184521 RepID=UPI003BB1E430